MKNTSKKTKFVLTGISMMALFALSSCGSCADPEPVPQPPIVVEPLK